MLLRLLWGGNLKLNHYREPRCDGNANAAMRPSNASTRQQTAMTSPLAPKMSVLISTRNRRRQLESVLQQLDTAAVQANTATEIVVVNNGSSDSTEGFLDTWQKQGEGRKFLTVPQPGKSRALNHALQVAGAPLLAFTDDDVIVPPDWIAAVQTFFREHPEYAAAMGAVRLPPSETSPEVARLVDCYPGIIPLFDAGPQCCDVGDMYGCNMAIRREALAVVGGFNEQLGPGANGYCDDTELSYRIRRGGMRIGYMPQAVMFHSVDRSRLTLAAFRDYQLRCAYGRYVMSPQQSWMHEAMRLGNAALSRIVWWLRRNEPKRLHALGRMIRHRELLRLRWRARGVAP